MAKPNLLSIPNMAIMLFLSLLFSSGVPLAIPTQGMNLQTYIVHVRKPPNTAFLSSEDRRSWHRSFLPSSILKSGNGDDRIVYSYEEVISGFAALLSEEEVVDMEKKEGFMFAQPEHRMPLQTTHSPSFLGLQRGTGLWTTSNMGKGVIIGVLDSGLGADAHPSFSDSGVPLPPSKWKGSCGFPRPYCNNKIIGARYFNLGQEIYNWPVDDNGHGTHVAGIAAGMLTHGASMFGYAYGTIAGTAPLAHLAIYKVCNNGICSESDVLAGIDAAIKDEVDVINLSIGFDVNPFYTRNMDIGSFSAMRKGIFVTCSAGNDGPNPYTLLNEAPWYLTVGASTTDRTISATVILGDGQQISGEGVFQAQSSRLTIVYPGANGDARAAQCEAGFLSGIDVRGKMVLCERRERRGGTDQITVVQNAGGAAMILMNTQDHGFSTDVRYAPIPYAYVSFSDGSKIKTYIYFGIAPTAQIVMKGTLYGRIPSIMVGSFSSRGPSQHGNILKPDIIGPGVSILAASASPFPLVSPYVFMSGTSMAAPHLSGIAALLKNTHPTWSPAAIKSAIMTTSDLLDDKGYHIVNQQINIADPFDMGSGHVNPSKANDPGLVYDLEPDDYIPYLCGLGYSNVNVGIIVGRTINCNNYQSIVAGALNYPSFYLSLRPSQSKTFSRTVTNVGDHNNYNYNFNMTKPQEVDVQVTILSPVNQKLTYTVTFTRSSTTSGSPQFVKGYLTWLSTPSKYVVRSPIVVRFDP